MDWIAALPVWCQRKDLTGNILVCIERITKSLEEKVDGKPVTVYPGYSFFFYSRPLVYQFYGGALATPI